MTAATNEGLPIESPQPVPKVMGLVPRSAFLWAAFAFVGLLIGLFLADVTGFRGRQSEGAEAAPPSEVAASAVAGVLANAPSPVDIANMADRPVASPSASPASSTVVAPNMPEPRAGTIVQASDAAPVQAGRPSQVQPTAGHGPATSAVLPEDAASRTVAAQAMAERYKADIQSLDEGQSSAGGGQLPAEARAVLQAAQSARALPVAAEQDFANFARDMAGTQLQQQRALDLLSRGSRQSPSQSDRAWIKEYGAEDDGSESKVRQLNLDGLVLQGTRIPVVAIESINSDMPGSVTAVSTSDIYDSLTQRRVAIPRGTRFNGSYSSEIRPGQTRLLFAFKRMVLPDGRAVDLMGATASDSIGRAGIEGDVDNHFLKMFGHSFAIAWIASRVSNKNGLTNSTSGNGVTSTGTVAGEVLGQVAQHILQRNSSIPPTISLPSGVPFNITLAKDVRLPFNGATYAR